MAIRQSFLLQIGKKLPINSLLNVESVLRLRENIQDRFKNNKVMMTTEFVLYGVLLTGILTAGITDLRSSRVPNLITFPLAIFGLGFHAMAESGNGILFSLEGLCLGLALLLGFYVSGGMGAGDVKLLAAVGAVVGPLNVFVGFLFAALLGGLYAVAMMVWYLGVSRTAERIMFLFVSMVFVRVNVAASLEETSLPKLRYALVLGLGTLMGQENQWIQTFLVSLAER